MPPMGGGGVDWSSHPPLSPFPEATELHLAGVDASSVGCLTLSECVFWGRVIQ